MIIQSSNTNFNTARSYKQRSTTYAARELLSGGIKEPVEEKPQETREPIAFTELLERNSKTHGTSKLDSLSEKMESLRKIRQQTIDYLLQMLFGDKTRTQFTDYNTDSYDELSSNISTNSTATLRTTNYFYYHEDETMSFSGSGTVVTADGREINFNIDLTMSRSFTQEYSQIVDVEQPILCDPLVINLDNNCTEVSDQKFYFDLDTDGVEDSISYLGKGSGFLALDKNGDGIVNDGSELFGTKSGNGFYDLAQYDSDGNGWIDEADAIFEALKIWMKSEDGTDKLISLKEAGVGALYLGSSDTQFSLNNAENMTNAMIRRTGMFLYEDGMAGTMHQLDLAT